MGRLSFPLHTRVYLDTAPIIYSVEKYSDYWSLLTDLWRSTEANEIDIITSELTLLETLVQPIRQNDRTLIKAYETLLTKTEIALYPITIDVLREAAKLRATQSFKTPDAIHLATASLSGCDHFVTNDFGFRRFADIEVTVLSDLV